ncbi:MAG: M1 family aminopeptidase [Ktedonobacteraceae bacterium]
MHSCNRIHAIDNGDGYSFFALNDIRGASIPQARSFELPDDALHYAPDRPADVRHVKLVVSLDFEQETVRGTAYTTFAALYEEIGTITFDAVELAIEQVTINGNAVPYTTTSKKLTVTLDRIYFNTEVFTVAVVYHAKPRTGLHFVKPAPEDPTRPVQAWSFGQPRYHSHWFPCHDAPNDRATTEIIVTAPSQFLTVSNGNLLEVIDNGVTKTHHWLHDIPHAAYLLSLVVSDFAVIEDSYKGKPVTYYVRKDRKDDALLLMGKTPQMMQFFSAFTGVEYPYDKYAQTVVELYTGAMEHTTATTHSFMLLMDKKAAFDNDTLVPIVAHELAHQWFGDLVTCRDWSNGWLNEGFATYFENMWNEHDLGRDAFKQSMLGMKAWYMGEDKHYRRPMVYHVFHDDGFELFDGHMYGKGAWVLHMLRHQLGEVAFKRAIKNYLERYREREVITADLERTFEESTGRSLAQYFQQWVYSGGYPEFTVNYSWDGERKLAKIKIKQTQKVDELTPCFVTPIDLDFIIPISDEAAKDEQTKETITVPMRFIVGEDGQVEQSFYVPLAREPLMMRFDPEGWLLKTLSFERSAKMLRYQLANDPDILGRSDAAQALGEKDDDESLAALKGALYNDPFWGVTTAAASALGTLGNEKAQTILIEALEQLDPTQFSRVRAAIADALGTFQAPQRAELAQRSAQALRMVLEKGDMSYRVESASASALGKTRTEGSVPFLAELIQHPSWIDTVQRGIFAGLGYSGDNRVVDTIAGYLRNPQSYPTLRLAAAHGLWTVGRNRVEYNEDARQCAVTALCDVIEHDPWEPVRMVAGMALASFNDKRAIASLERAAGRELDSSAQRQMRLSAHALRSSDKDDEQFKGLRKDLNEIREENRKLKEQLTALEAKIK